MLTYHHKGFVAFASQEVLMNLSGKMCSEIKLLELQHIPGTKELILSKQKDSNTIMYILGR